MAIFNSKSDWAKAFEDWRWRRSVLGEQDSDPEERVTAGQWDEIQDEGVDLLFHAARLIDPSLDFDGQQNGATT